MRIQHNIPAMSSYRNYTRNVSAVNKNLEKLSSGYRINRAGDDAAGLAISEKMRLQISGLEQAQNNAKSGINLVQTAEGALTEVHDMLNRMYTLAEQSANGTYSDEVDREQLQKEIKSLSTEIDRIADATNYNGIKLLNGDLSDGSKAAVAAKTGNFEIPGVGELQDDLGVKTITHTSGVTAGKITFGVELGDLKFSNKDGESLEISIGNSKITLGNGFAGKAADAEFTAKDIVTGLLAATSTANNDGITMTGMELTATAKTWEIDGIEFTVDKNTEGTGLVFTQKGEGDFNGDMAVSVEGKDLAEANTPGKVTGAIADSAVKAADETSTTAKSVYTYDFTGITGLTAGDYTLTAGGKTVNITLEEGATNLSDLLGKAVTELNKTANQISDGAGKYVVATTGNTLTFTASGTTDTSGNAVSGAGAIAAATQTEAGGVSGTYNTQTTNTKPSAAGAEKNLASTVITLDAAKMGAGSKVIFGKTAYTFTADEADKTTGVAANADNKVYVGDLDLNTDAGLKAAIDRLSVVAAGNEVWSVGYAGEGGKVTVTEKANADGTGWMDQADANKKDFDLTTVEGIKKSLGFETAAQAAVEGDPSKGLSLQIGDTADSYNKMVVAINDMHAASLGIGDIDISSQDGASAAMAKIQAATNMVSDVRGSLGALQNRLDHTINNLSVTQENIQDAESTIRDVDIAKEMMAYTKNNILVQSAQAMLAQANQLPQGVLQLLG